MHCYTSFSYSYLNRARVLAKTLKRHHPDWVLWAVITDEKPEDLTFDPASDGFDRVLTPKDLFGPTAPAWLFGHNVVEACTAVKGEALRHIFASGAGKVIYLDPDIAVFGPLTPLDEMLDSASIVLTPHQCDPEEDPRAVLDNEVASLLHGVFNLGFIAVANDAEGRRFADWWADRLHTHCHDRKTEGIFVDQKWINLVPGFFDGVRVLRDPGYNVASWNISRRRIEITRAGDILVNGVPLRFFHFTKLGVVGDTMTERYAGDNTEVFELWAWYKCTVEAATDPAIPAGWWHYGNFANGRAIPQDVRVLYRTRRDLQHAFPDPASASEPSFHDWLVAEGHL